MTLGGVPSFSRLDEHASGGDEHAGRGTTASAKSAPLRIAPIYKRLPHGPHRLARNEVIQNQRARIHGAMIESVVQYGYKKTSVKRVVALAGVSRRSFYELFANKEQCFLTSLDLIAARAVKRTNEAYRAADGDLEYRLRAAFEQFIQEVAGDDSKGASLVIVEAPAVGAAGMLHLCRATGAFERMLLSSFEHAREEGRVGALPLPIVRGIVGGLHEVISVHLRTDRAKEIPALTEEMLRWTLLFGACAPEDMAVRLSERARVNLRSATNDGQLDGDASRPDARERLLESALRLTVIETDEELSAAQIADEAGVSIDSFFELFEHQQACVTAAFNAMGDELLQITADPELVGQDWPRAVRKTIGALMHHLAAHPFHARMIATGVYAAGPDAIEQNYELAHEIATLLTEGSPEIANDAFTVESVAGAIWHTVRCQVAGEQISRLPALTDYLAYVVLAPLIGAEAAAEAVTKDD
jgi:AcrR family transcriptional regulator